MNEFSINFRSCAQSKKSWVRVKKFGIFFHIDYERMHGDSMLEGTFETNRRHLRNPFENISEAVLEILGVYPGKGTMVNIVLEQGGTLRKISGILKERVVEKVSKVT